MNSAASSNSPMSDIPIQDAGGKLRDAQPTDWVIYHTHGWRQYMGTCKEHARLDCPHLVNWKPGRHPMSRAERVVYLHKTVMRETTDPTWNFPNLQCRTCWPAGTRPQTVAEVLAGE